MARKETRTQLKGAIFDLDGVIVDTVLFHFRAWRKMFSEYGKNFTFQDYKEKVDGIPRVDGARAILEDIPEDEVKKAAARKQSYFLDFLKQDKIPVYESTVNLVKELRSNAFKTAVISSSQNCEYILKKIDILDLFDAVIAGDDIERGKPDPDIFLLAAEELGLRVSECAVFEDALLGVEAAKRGGFFTVGIDRYQNPERLDRADVVISDPSELSVEKLKEYFLQ